MYLKRIVLHGFKSFADRTEFEFGSGRTAIVGPNGCGKSNILDALRWVLGEQSARTLRGRKMLDVVFAGSRTRKPANFAQVDLTFDNSTHFLASEEDEVTVTRVLYRNGDSEYRINGKRCRMKDIRDLLLDTGVGVDAYSVIEQGRVDALLQANPAERREIFEEAAGVSRYRVRRAEAQRKLERTQNNLLRLNDVIEELERRLRSVKLAAGKARRFQEYDARLRELRSSFSLAEYHDLQQTLARQGEDVRAQREMLESKRVALARLDADAAELQHRVQALDEEIQQAEERLRELETEDSAVGERITQSRRRLEELAQTQRGRTEYAEQAARQARELAARLADDERELEALTLAQRAQAEHIGALETQREQAAEQLEAARSALEQQRAAAFEAARRTSRLHNEHENLQRQTQQIESRLATLTQRREAAESQRGDLAVREAGLRQRCEELDAQSGELAAQIREKDAQLEQIQSRIEQHDQQLAGIKERHSAALSRLNLLEDLEQRQEGVGQGARAVLRWAEDGPEHDGSVVGLVADVLRIDDPRVDALAAVLARFENLVVVRDGYAFLAELGRRDEQPGSLGVIALDRVGRQPPASQDYREAPGFVARAADWVRCEEAYRPLAEFVLGRTIVVDVMERAMALAQGAPAGYTFVTLDGDTVESDGRLTLGAAKGLVGLISRKAQIRQLQGEIDEIETQLEQTTRARAELEAQRSDQRVQREALLERIATTQKHHAEARTELVRLDDERRRLEREITALRGETDELGRTAEQLREQLRRVEAEHSECAQDQQAHESQIEALDGQVRQMEQRLEAASQELTAARVEAGRAAERCSARQRALEAQRQQLQTLHAQREAAEREAREAQERIAAAQEECRASEQRREELAAALQSQRGEVLRQRERRQEVRQQLEACGASVRDLHGEIEQADAQLREIEVALRESEVRKESLVSRVADELGIDLAALYERYEHTEQDWEAVRAEIEELRGKITRLGNVNLDAIAELEELTPRYENLVAQRDDLLESIERLDKLIAELDEESRTRFLACFEEVRENFHELFRKLFGGGKADIILEDPERPLECGIEIIARPPGKEPRSISLLSGGEKTMTAVALLFAIFKRKPSPFAILDEVDAALDESNIDRFNNMVHDFLTRSQFILITHSKRTMQTADVLYGITMEEPGVSKRVSVRFEERVDTPVVA